MAVLDRGDTIEVAGYRLTGHLATGIRNLTFNGEEPGAGIAVRWLEIYSQQPAQPGRATQQVVDAWAATGVDVRYEAVAGESFWSSTEIVHCEALIDRSLVLLGH